MIRGIGVDLVEIDRIQSAMGNKHFIARIFTDAEQTYANGKSRPAESYAGMFAAKEAVLKAFGTGLGGADFLEIEVLHAELGNPVLYLHGKARERLVACGSKHAHVSISHTKTHAVAQVILED